MSVLLDTHAFLWFSLGDSRISVAAKNAILDSANDKLVSPASFIEIAIKISLGKYSLAAPFEQFVSESVTNNGFAILPLSVKHASELAKLPFHHRDPFDRMLLAQAISEDIPIVSTDSVFDSYPVRRIW